MSFWAWWTALSGKAPPDVPNGLHAVAAGGPQKPYRLADAVKLQAYYLAHVARPATDELKQRRAEWEKARAEHFIAADAIPGTLVFKDLPVPRDSFVMIRGQYNKPGEAFDPAEAAEHDIFIAGQIFTRTQCGLPFALEDRDVGEHLGIELS